MAIWRPWLVLVVALIAAPCAHAAESRFALLLDTDGDASTGCTAPSANGALAGIDLIATTIVTTSASGGVVTRLEQQHCTGGAWSTPTLYDAGGWPVGIGAGLFGTAVIETSIPRALLPTRGTIRAVATAEPVTGAPDATSPFSIALDNQAGEVLAVPLSPWLLALLTLAIGGATWQWRRRHPHSTWPMALSVGLVATGIAWAATAIRDGRINDWAGVAPAVVDVQGDAAVNGDIVAVFIQRDESSVHVRIDADVRTDAVSNLAPSVSAGTNQSITLPQLATLAGSAVDDGLPAPPGQLQSNWTKVSGPGAVAFADPASPSTTAQFDQAGIYVLRLTASDGQLSASAEVTVVVNAIASAAPTIAPIGDRTIDVGSKFQQLILATSTSGNDTLSFALPTAPGGAAFRPAPLLDWTPTLDQVGVNDFVVQVSDRHGRQATVSFRVTVNRRNTAPQLSPQADETVGVGIPFTRTLDAVDVDPGDALTLALVGGPSGMTLSGNQLHWPTAGLAIGAYPVQVKVSDSHGASSTQSFFVVLKQPVAPVARDDEYTVQVNRTLTVPAAGVLTNDLVDTSRPLVSRLTGGPSLGNLSRFGADGGFSFIAPASLPQPAFDPVETKRVRFTGDEDFFSWQLADLNGDGRPDAIALGSSGKMQAVDLHNSVSLWTTEARPAGCVLASSQDFSFAVGDIDDDGVPEVVVSAQCPAVPYDPFNHLLAFDGRNGALKWKSESLALSGAGAEEAGLAANWNGVGYPVNIARLRVGEKPSVLVGTYAAGWGRRFVNGVQVSIRPHCAGIALAVPDGDWQPPESELGPHYQECVGAIVVDGTTGQVTQRLIQKDVSRNAWRGNLHDGGGYQGVIVADLDGDGSNEIAVSGAVWKLGGSQHGQNTAVVDQGEALANLDDEPDLERVIVDSTDKYRPRMVARKHDGRELWALPLPGLWFGQVTIADLDGDGAPDILLPISFSQSRSELWAIDRRGNLQWTRDLPCAAICSGRNIIHLRAAAFDLDGDGTSEVVVPNRGELLFLNGSDGQIRARRTAIANPAEIIWNTLPRIVDIDRDGHAGVAYLYKNRIGWCCAADTFNEVVVYKDAANAWRPARRIDHQWAYFGANIRDDATVPAAVPLPNDFATPAGNVFGTQPQVLIPADPRERRQTQFTYHVNDGVLDSAPATVRINIDPANRSPRFTSVPPTRHQGSLSYQAAARDPDPGDTLSYAIETQVTFSGTACTVTSTGLLACPDLGMGGDSMVVLSANDTQGGKALQTLRLAPSGGAVTVPNVVGMALAGATTTLQASSLNLGAVRQTHYPSVPAQQVLTQYPPPGASILAGEAVDLGISLGPPPVTVPNLVGTPVDAALARIAGLGLLPAIVPVASSLVPAGEVTQQDQQFGSTVAAGSVVTLTVALGPPPSAPVAQLIVAPAPSASRLIGDTVDYRATAIFADGSSQDVTLNSLWSSSAPAIASISTVGAARALSAGNTTISATAGGKTGLSTLAVLAPVAESTPPVAAITVPADATELSGPVAVVGTASDANLLRYELAYAADGDPAFTVFAEGSSPVNAGTLGTFDPTQLINGAYMLRLRVFDRGGNEATALSSVVVSGRRKVGAMTLSYNDLSIPLPGYSIQITRNYDSREKRSGDFGIGWTLALKGLRVSANGLQGNHWMVLKSGLSYQLASDRAHVVTVALPNGKVETFHLQVTPAVSPLVPLASVTATYVAGAGATGTLELLDNPNLLIVDPQPGQVTLVDDTTLATFDPDGFRYTQPDGTQWVVTRSKGVRSVRDAAGNQLTVDASGMSHSTGLAVRFTRDGQGRITGISDPLGNTRTYAYSAAGDLAAASDRTGNTSRYTYNRFHDLIGIRDPTGREALRADYDVDGRLLAITDATGNQTRYTHDLPGRVEQVEDALGHVTTATYDERGNVLSVTDPLGNTTRSTYDGHDNLLSRTDALGGITTYTYDANDAVTSIVDANGAITRFTRDAAGRELSRTDARGNTVTTEYDVNGKPVKVADALGNIELIGYDAQGKLVSLTTPSGAVSTNQYDANGWRTRNTTAAGLVTDLSYDATGRVVGQQAATGMGWILGYDAEGRITALRAGAQSRSVTYDAAGAPSGMTSSSGQLVRVEVDAAGRFTGLTGAGDSALLGNAYDARGQVTEVRDALGNATRYEWDAGGRRTAITRPDGSVTRFAYDALGRPTQKTDALGNVTSYRYDALGNLAQITDALGGVTQYQYDPVGNLSAFTDAAGQTTSYAYDAANRLIRTTYSDGTFETMQYDADGRPVQATDAAGWSTRWSYDGQGRPTAVTDALGNVTRYEYQGTDRHSAIVDGNGQRTTYGYDASGRLTATGYPLGDTSSYIYDAAGRLASSRNGAGERVYYTYDDQGRLTRITLPDGSTVSLTYTQDGLIEQMTDSGGTTLFAYDPVTRLLQRVTEPDGHYLRYVHDALGNRILLAQYDGSGEKATTYSYDALGQLVRIVDPDGAATTQSYDAVGNLARIARPDGFVTTMSHDTRHRPTVIETRQGATILDRLALSYDRNGNRTRIDRADGSHVEYRYDGLNRVVAELRYRPDASVEADLLYHYDAAGNLIRSGPTGAPTTFTYNANSQLVAAAGVRLTYDAAGRRVGEDWTQGGVAVNRRYTWNALEQLIGFGNPAGSVTRYEYDGLGERRMKTDAGAFTSYLNDRRSLTGFTQVVGAMTPAGPQRFLWGERWLDANDAGTKRYPIWDALGSTVALAASDGSVTDRFGYDAYGAASAGTGASTLPHRFAGEQTDAESGLSYLRARYYDPRTGGFLTRDPAPGNPFEPLSFHPYLYASGNPVNRRDPSGRQTLIEQMQVQALQKINDKWTQIQNVVKGIEKTEETVAAVMRDAGGIIAVGAVLDAATDDQLIVKWFGGLIDGAGRSLDRIGLGNLARKSPLGTLNAATGFFDIGFGQGITAIKVPAMAAMMKTALDLFARKDVDMQIQVFGTAAAGSAAQGCKPDYHAYAQKTGSGWTLGLCRPFFTDVPLPMANRISMAGVMVHEFSHIASNRLIRDDAYLCNWQGPEWKPGARSLSLVPGAALFNADSYRCWAEDAYVGGLKTLAGLRAQALP